ncbi:MAG TPA: hypothetical protein VM261_33945 [Kofleriaceae bacterium]|nr:hypothetical protein [Kofleriaceae bacterium]
MTRQGLVSFALVVLASCSGKPAPASAPSPETETETETETGSGSSTGTDTGSGPTSGSGVPVMDGCTRDEDCEIHVSCCAHCDDNGIVASINQAYAAYGMLLTLTFYCPSCAEGGCTRSAPKRTPICKAGHCARRDVWTDDAGKTTTSIMDNDPSQLVLTPDRELMVNIMHHACTRALACGAADMTASDCDQLKVPQSFSCPAAVKCYAAIDAFACPATPGRFDLLGGLSDISKLPACEKLDRMCLNP